METTMALIVDVGRCLDVDSIGFLKAPLGLGVGLEVVRRCASWPGGGGPLGVFV